MDNHISYYETIIKLCKTNDISIELFTSENIANKLKINHPGLVYNKKKNEESYFNFFKRAKINNDIDLYIVEQAYGETISFILGFMRKATNHKIVYTVHNVNSWVFPKYYFSFRSLIVNTLHLWIIKRVKGVAVMNKNIYDVILNSKSKSIKPFYIPFSLPSHQINQSAAKKSNIKIVIPGTINSDRRNYTVILNAFSLYLKKEKNNQIELILLGKPTGKADDISITINQIHEIEKLDENAIKYWENFIPNDEFEREMINSDILLSNLVEKYPYKKNIEIYGLTKESGITSLMLNYQKPCIVYGNFQLPKVLIKHSLKVHSESELISFFQSVNKRKDLIFKLSDQYPDSIISYKKQANESFVKLLTE